MKKAPTCLAVILLFGSVCAFAHSQDSKKVESSNQGTRSTKDGPLKDNPTETKDAIRDAVKKAKLPQEEEAIVNSIFNKIPDGAHVANTVYIHSGGAAHRKLVLMVISGNLPDDKKQDAYNSSGRGAADAQVAKNNEGKEMTKSQLEEKEKEARDKFDKDKPKEWKDGKEAVEAGVKAANAVNK